MRPILPARLNALARFQLYGPPLLAVYLLATSRWGSYVIPGPPYISDIVLGGLLIAWLIGAANHRAAVPRMEASVALLASILVAWSGIVFLTGTYSIAALRDAAPYFYVLIVFLVRPLDGSQEGLVSRWITAALVIHALWVSLTLAAGHIGAEPFLTQAPTDGGNPLYVFALRPDFDMLVCGLLATLSIHRALLGRAPVVNLLLGLWNLGLIAAMSNRAGLIALAVQFLVLALLSGRRRQERVQAADGEPSRRSIGARQKGMVSVALIVCAIPVVVYLAPQSTAISRAAAWVTGSQATWSGTSANPNATANARKATWTRVADWLEEKRSREILGVGFGPNYLFETGAVASILGGQTRSAVRAPHSFEIDTWARLGLVGLAIWLAILIAGIALAVRVARVRAERFVVLRDTDLLAILVVVSVPLVAAIGVISESPFGAIPYFWALGHLSVRAFQIGVAPSFAGVIGHRRLAPLPPEPVRLGPSRLSSRK